MKTLWWIFIFILLFNLYSRAATNEDLQDNTDDDDDDDAYEEVTDVPVETVITTAGTKNEEETITDIYTDSGERSVEDNKEKEISTNEKQNFDKNSKEEFVSMTSVRSTTKSEFDSIRDLFSSIAERDNRNLKIICSVSGCALFIIIVVLLCLLDSVTDLRRAKKDELIKAEEGQA
ncbi:hypothetical protein XENTR_v10013788 [Xenopus tropicalis]|nr:hypothetical protein XENTR_v10013788 [Xenopus tropicalis]